MRIWFGRQGWLHKSGWLNSKGGATTQFGASRQGWVRPSARATSTAWTRQISSWVFVLVSAGFIAATMAVPAIAADVHRVEMAQARGGIVNLEIQTDCKDERATFKITNAGAAWPKTGIIGVYRVRADGSASLISKRNLRLTDGQHASFRVRTKGASRLAMFVAPSWYKRDFAYDAQVACK